MPCCARLGSLCQNGCKAPSQNMKLVRLVLGELIVHCSCRLVGAHASSAGLIMQTLVALVWVTFVDMQYQQQRLSLDAHVQPRVDPLSRYTSTIGRCTDSVRNCDLVCITRTRSLFIIPVSASSWTALATIDRGKSRLHKTITNQRDFLAFWLCTATR